MPMRGVFGRAPEGNFLLPFPSFDFPFLPFGFLLAPFWAGLVVKMRAQF
jgi:hypothetical protein